MSSLAQAAPSRSRQHPAPRDDFRPDIQGLRAVAVALVVIFHWWPHRLSGGYVGVDVFFVISGYLITRHLAGEVERTGRVRLLAFWARRARRLLPAAFLVLLASLAMVWLWLPKSQWADSVRQITASAFYVENWALARDAVDYSASQAGATVVQHYWSLSVEEQFYVAWPLLILLLLAVRRGLLRIAGRAPATPVVLALGLAVATVVSLVYSVVETRQDQAWAYFATPTRVWEFALGGFLGIWWTRDRLSGPLSAVLAWLGVALMLVAGFVYTEQTAFPGWLAAIPVVGTALVLAAAPGSGRAGPVGLLTLPPMRFLGDISYALYLWHWPIITVAAALTAGDAGDGLKAALLLVSVVIAWASTRLVEAPLRGGRLLRPTAAALAFAAAGMALITAAGSVLLQTLPPDREVTIPDTTTSCRGPGALDPANGCRSVTGRRPFLPSTLQASRQNKVEAYPGCQSGIPGTTLGSCAIGAPAEGATATVALVGDSHAGQWLPAFDRLGQQRGWHVVAYAKSSCPASFAVRTLPSETTDDNQVDCGRWVRSLAAELVAKGYDAVFTAAYSTAYGWKSPADFKFSDPGVQGFQEFWGHLNEAGIAVYPLEEVPRTNGGYVPQCLDERHDPLACSVPVGKAMPASRPLFVAARGYAESGQPGSVKLIRLRDQFCDSVHCYVVVGRMLVYRDYSHLTKEYAEALVPFIDRQLPADITTHR